MVPQGYVCTKTHEWAKLDAASGIVTVGITDYAVEQLGDIVYLELPAAGKAIQAEKVFGVIESVKAAVELYAPLDGQVVESNKAIADQLDVLAADPYNAGWMLKVKPAKPEQLAGLMSPEAYKKYLESDEAKKH
jgi:glycine cleavage system H protein